MEGRVWTIRDALEWMTRHFERVGVDVPRRSAEWLLSAATSLSRVELYAHFDRPLSETERTALRDSIKRRAAGEPLQYVTGEMPFRHIVVHVVPGVFIPRPETEVLVDECLKLLNGVESPVVLDICTGSGCIACAIASEHPQATVVATDVSEIAVVTAEKNAARIGVAERVSVVCGDLFAPVVAELRGTVHVVAANPPYIPTANLASLPLEVSGHEPAAALDGGADGLGIARRIATDALEWLTPTGACVMELDETCVRRAAEMVGEWYLEVEVVSDLVGRDRVLVAKAPRQTVRPGQSYSTNGGGSQ
ncbi:MAG: peptide chain release factor N(5)-glutamine methyltransferase [Clostridiales bacterium]|nr:peptide chain release factor N(5)-glutamine methyltransferase [Clostridiales bacterium]